MEAAMIPLDRLEQITQRFEFIEAQMAQGGGDIAQLGREYAELRPVVEEIRAYREVLDDISGARAMLDDPEMKELAEDELATLERQRPELEATLQLALLPKDAADVRPAMVEIRPGTGGEEAALFAGDLLRMYQRYAEARGWTFEIIDRKPDRAGRRQRSGRPCEGAERLCPDEIRIRGAPGAAGAGNRIGRAYPYLCRHCGRAARGRGCGHSGGCQ